MDAPERYRMSLSIELSFLVTLTVLGAVFVAFGGGFGLGFGGVLLGLAAIVAVVTWRKSRKHLYLSSTGLMTKVGDRVTVQCSWDDVRHIWIWTTRIYNAGGSEYGLYENLPRCTLQLADGRKLHLARGPYQPLDEITRYVERQVAGRILARRRQELADTGQTRFGPILLTDTGVEAGTRVLPWSDLTRVDRGRVRLRIRSGDRVVISRQIRTIPDVSVLLSMLAERAG